MKKYISLAAAFALAATPVLAIAEEGVVTTDANTTAEVKAETTMVKTETSVDASLRMQKEKELMMMQKEKREAALMEKKAMLETTKQERSATLETKKMERAGAMEEKKMEKTESMEARKIEMEEKRMEKQNDLLMKAKERADKEIMRRIEGLEALSDRVAAMKRLSESDKASLEASLSAERAKLVALQSSIAADTSTSTLRSSIESIGKSYRVFALVMPKASITAAADRVLSVAAQMDQVLTKLSARASTLKASGTDTTALDALLADMSAKIAEAKRLAQAAIDQVSVLVPDEGDKANMQANNAEMRSAQSKIKEAQSALKAAHENARKVVAGIKGSGRVGGEVETTSSTQ